MPFFQQSAGLRAFGETWRFELYNLISAHDLKVATSAGCHQRVDELLFAQTGKPGIHFAIMPHKGGLFHFQFGAGSLVDKLLQDIEDLFVPVHGLDIFMPFSIFLVKSTVLSGKGEIEVAKPAFKSLMIPSAANDDMVLFVITESFQDVHHLFSWDGIIRIVFKAGKSPIVIKDEQPSVTLVIPSPYLKERIFFDCFLNQCLILLSHALKLLQKVCHPLVYRMFGEVFLHDFHTSPLLFFGHLQSLKDGILYLSDIIGIDNHSVAQFDGCTCHLTEYEYAGSIALSCHIFLSHKIHPIAQRRYQCYVSNVIHGNQLFKTEAMVEVIDGVPVDRGIDTVDLADGFINGCLQTGVFIHLIARGYDDHGKGYFLPVFRMIFEKQREPSETVKNPFAIVKPVH